MNEFQVVPISQVVESSTNPRRRFGEQGMQDLTDSVAKHGVLVPLLVRPRDKRNKAEKELEALNLLAKHVEDPFQEYEIIAGARRYRAAKAAGLSEIPVRVKEIGDTEALELQILENLQREDVHPLEEALGYRALLDRPGYDVPAIAVKVGKSESYIYQRLKLAELIKSAQNAFLEDRITAGHAILIARLQPKDQEEALKNCFCDRWGYSAGIDANVREKECRSIRDLSGWIQENIHLDLHAAPFGKDSEDLVPAAGPCTTCPKRTGFVPQLFPDIAKKDTCTDRNCYEQKLQAHIARKKAELGAKGEQLLEVSSEYSSNKKTKPGDPLTGNQYSQIRDKKDRCGNARKAIIVEGYRDRGKMIEICTDKACKKHHGTSGCDNSKYLAQQKRQEERAAATRKTRLAILDEVLGRVKAPLCREDLVQVALGFWTDIWSDLQKKMLSRRGWEAEKKKGGYGIDYDGIGRKNITLLTDDGLAGFLLELSVARQIEGLGYGNPKDHLKEMAGRYKVNVKTIEKKVAAEISEKKKANKAKAGQKSSKPAKADQNHPKLSKAEETKLERMKSYWAKRRAEATKPKKKKAKEPACERCGCVEERACPGGCAWSADFLARGRHVCTSCEEEVIHA